MIARLLHIANTSPPADKKCKERFYAMKQRILRRFGAEDGHDIQHIPGKKCWSCDGTGEYYEPHDCHKCDGTGWFKSPVWVLLKRWKFGRYTFHEPIKRHYRKPDDDLHDRPIIKGYVEHASYSLKKTYRARLILALLFDWQLLWMMSDNWWIRKVISRKCHICKRRLWTTKRWQCSTCQVLSDTKTFLEQDDETPF